jgi:hypothetical protein
MNTFMDDLLAEVEEKEQRVKLELDRLKADQLLMAVAKFDSQIEDVNKLCDDEIKLIENYRQTEVERINKKRSWLLLNVEGWARQQLEQSGDKTIRLPHATLALRKGRDKVEIQDMETFLKVATRYGLLKTTPEEHTPNLTEIAAFVKRTGRIPIGTKLIPGTINFSYTLNTKGEPSNGTE